NSKIHFGTFQCGRDLQLQLAESVPSLLEIGSNQEESNTLLNDHELLLVKLKAMEGGVWGLLCEADKTAEENKDQSQVYHAIAETLSEAWDALINLLQERSTLLNLAAEFFDRALEFAIKIDDAEEFLHHPHELKNVESLNNLLHQHHCLKKVLLEKSMALLVKSQELVDFILKIKSDEPKMNPESKHGARSSCMKTETLLELLQDRRRQLEEKFKQQHLELKQILQIYQWNQQEEEIAQWFREYAESYALKTHLGSSLSENEELLHEYKEFVFKAKEWRTAVEKLKSEAEEILLAVDYTDKEQLSIKSQKLKMVYEDFWHHMEERRDLLQEANEFFQNANKAFDVLGGIEAYLKLLNSQGLSLPVLAREHERLQKVIKDESLLALRKGQALLTDMFSFSSQVRGIQDMIGYIQKRVDQLSSQCHAHKELAVKKQQLTVSFEDHVDKVLMWVEKCTLALADNKDPGSCLSESEKCLNKHLELSSQAKEVSIELDAIKCIIKELNQYEVPEVAALSTKASLLLEEHKTILRNINSQQEILNVYTDFLKSAKELDEYLQILEEIYKYKPTGDSKEDKKSVLEAADAKWQLFLEKFLLVQDMGQNFIKTVNMTSDTLSLNLEAAVKVTEITLEKLMKKKLDLTDLWTIWQLHVNEMKSVKKQWKKFKEQVKKTIHSLRSLEDDLIPATKVDLGDKLQTVIELQENFNQVKTKFQQLNAEVEYMVKISELLALKGIPLKEKSNKISELLSVHQRLKMKIKEYETILTMAVKFHQVAQELENFSNTEELHVSYLAPVPHNASQAKMQLNHHQRKQIHVRHLYKLALTLGVDIISAVQCSKITSVSVKQLQQKIKVLESDSIDWSAKADEHQEVLLNNVHYCTVKEEMNELKESFKEMKKKFNNLKFNYIKKSEKARNLKASSNQIQQVEVYAEKIQSFKKKLKVFEEKLFINPENQGDAKSCLIKDLSELKKQISEFDKTVEEYKQNLDVTMHLQQTMEECQFWFEEASATVIRVGKYSSECKTKEAVGILCKQFEKFLLPTVPTQEERIQQITELAVRLHSPDEGRKLVGKTVAKHKEILASINELCNNLRKLEEKLQVKHITSLVIILVLFPEESNSVAKSCILHCLTVLFFFIHKQNCDLLCSLKIPGTREDSKSQAAFAVGDSVIAEKRLGNEILTDEALSIDEYECMSSDNISLPPLPDTPELHMFYSETELEEGPSCSSHNMHAASYNLLTQKENSSIRISDSCDLLTPVPNADTVTHTKEQVLRNSGSHPLSNIKSPLTVPAHGIVCNTFSSISTANSFSAHDTVHEVYETHMQQYAVHECMIETQGPLHVINDSSKADSLKTDKLLALKNDALTAIIPQSSHHKGHHRQTIIQQEIKHASENRIIRSLSGQAPNFSKFLSNVTVMEGSPVALEVEVTGFPEPALTWWVAYNNQD
uniref:Coiled-coil domain containing 141 n=1 Tax=Latimeria chalumnae TaxID=7897 RepID=H3AX26_LATCH